MPVYLLHLSALRGEMRLSVSHDTDFEENNPLNNIRNTSKASPHTFYNAEFGH